jgi:arsenite-transporting ATPase
MGMVVKRVLSFWGKGGVGKTTISSAFAVALAERGYSVYLLSSDFMPSMHDVLELPLTYEPVKVMDNLVVEQLFEDKIIDLWKKRFGDEVYRVASSIFPVGPEIIDYVAGAPGIVEEFTLYYIYELFRNLTCDIIVWDTVATGGGLRMLKIEKEFYEHLGEAVKLYLKVKGVLDKIRTGSEEPLKLIDSWRLLAQDVLSFLKNASHFATLVSRPFPIDFQVAVRAYQELSQFVPIRFLFINMVSFSGEEKEYLKKFEETFERKLDIFRVPRFDTSPRGINALRKLISEKDLEKIESVVF